MIDRKKIQAGLAHGSKSEVARRAGVSLSSVSNWFTGSYNSARIADAAVEVYAEDVAKRKMQQAKFNAAQRGEVV